MLTRSRPPKRARTVEHCNERLVGRWLTLTVTYTKNLASWKLTRFVNKNVFNDRTTSNIHAAQSEILQRLWRTLHRCRSSIRFLQLLRQCLQAMPCRRDVQRDWKPCRTHRKMLLLPRQNDISPASPSHLVGSLTSFPKTRDTSLGESKETFLNHSLLGSFVALGEVEEAEPLAVGIKLRLWDQRGEKLWMSWHAGGEKNPLSFRKLLVLLWIYPYIWLWKSSVDFQLLDTWPHSA